MEEGDGRQYDGDTHRGGAEEGQKESGRVSEGGGVKDARGEVGLG